MEFKFKYPILLFIAFLTGAILTTQHLKQSTNRLTCEHSQQQKAGLITENPISESLLSENNLLKEKLKSTLAQLALYRGEPTTPKPEQLDNPLLSQTVTNEQSSSALLAELESLRAYKVNSEAQRIVSWFSSAEVTDHLSQLADAFESDLPPTPWSYAQEQVLNSLFQDHQALTRFNVEQSECRATRCRLSVTTSNTEEASQLMSALSTAFQQTPELANRPLLVMRAPDSSNSFIYLSKDASSGVYQGITPNGHP